MYDDNDILAILDGQSEGYLIHPGASAFVAAGFTDADEVEAALLRLAEAGHAQEHEDVLHEVVMEPVMLQAMKDGEPVVKKGKAVMEHLTDAHGDLAYAPKRDDNGVIVTQPKRDANGNEEIINHGFEITAKGRKAAPPKPEPEGQ